MTEMEQSTLNANRVLDTSGMPQPQALEALVANRVAYREFREWMTRAYVMEVLKQAKGNQSEAARIAGMHRNSFTILMHRLKIRTAGERRKERRDARRRKIGLKD